MTLVLIDLLIDVLDWLPQTAGDNVPASDSTFSRDTARMATPICSRSEPLPEVEGIPGAGGAIFHKVPYKGTKF